MSGFFASSPKREDPIPVISVIKTNGFIDGLTLKLITSAHDRNEDVRMQMKKSIKDIGDKHPEMVLSTCCNYMQTGSVSVEHKVTLMTTMKQIIEDNRTRIPKHLALGMIQFAFSEMVSEKEVRSEWQSAASSIIVTLGVDYGQDVLDAVSKRLDVGAMPHYFVVKTLGDLAISNPNYVVPNLKEIFGRIVALMGAIKHDNLRWVFSATVGHFCEAILHFLANADTDMVARSGITKNTFSGEVFSSYEMMYNQWLQRNESPLRLAIVQAIGYMSHLLLRDQFESQLPKIVNGILATYKKEKNFLPITQGLCLVLEASVENESRVLDPLLLNIMTAIHFLVCNGDLSPTNPTGMRNFNELLRCFEMICKVFSDNVVNFLIQKIEPKDEKTRIGTLSILKHLVNSSEQYLENKKELIVNGLKPVLSEVNNKVKKSFSQVVITLASHDYLSLEGGNQLIEYIVRQCSITDAEEELFQKNIKGAVGDIVSPSQLRSMCDNILSLLTTTIPIVEKVLWPYLLEFILPVQYTESVSIVAKSVAFLGIKKREGEEEDYMIDFDRLVNLPKPPAIISRLLVIMSQPNARPQLGENILAFFKAVGPVLHPSIWQMWDEVIPKMQQFLKDKSADPVSWVQSKWEDLILKFLIKTIEEVNDDEWTTGLGEEMCKQFQLYNTYPNYKSMLFKLIGVVLQKSEKKSFVRDKLDYMFTSVDHNRVEDRNGCAIGYGYCSSSHLDTVLDKLQTVLQGDSQKKSGGLFGFLSDSSEKNVEMTKCTVMLCYGYASAKADKSLIKSRLEVNIINNILPQINTARSVIMKEHIIKAIELIGKTMHPNHLESEYQTGKRKDLLLAMIKFLTTETKGEINNEVRVLSLQACATLCQLNALSLEEETEVLGKSLAVIMKYPHTEQDTIESFMESLESIIGSIIEKNPETAVLNRLLEHIAKYLGDAAADKRKKAIKLIYVTLETFFDNASAQEEEEEEEEETEEEKPKLNPNAKVDIVIIMQWIATIIPRATDPEEEIRVCSIECIGKLIELKGLVSEITDTLSEKIATLSDKITVSETNTQFAVVHDLAKSLAPEINEKELFPFVEILLKGLTDSAATSASGTCIVLNGILRARGAELGPFVSAIIQLIYNSMKVIQNEQTMNGTLHSLKTLAGHHLGLVATEFLGFELPHDQFVIKAIQALAKDPKLGEQLMKFFVQTLDVSQPYSEKEKRKNEYTKEGTKPTAHATVLLGEMFEVEEMKDICKEYIPNLMTTLLVRIGSTNGIDKANSFNRVLIEDSIYTFEKFLTLIEDEEILALIKKEDFKKEVAKEKYYDQIFDVAKLMFKLYEEKTKDIVELMIPISSHNFDSQRITIVASFGAFISVCSSNSDLLRSLINTLVVRLSDPNLTIKLLVLRGLGNIADSSAEEVNRFSATILSALMSGMEDPKSETPEIILEALQGLSKVMKVVDGSNVVAILVNICIKLRPYFETQNNDIRRASIVLFGNLTRFGEGPCQAVFYEQIHTHFVSFLLHLNEDDQGIKQAVKTTLRQIGPLLQAPDMNDFFQQTLLEEKNVQYGEFIHKLSKLIISYFHRNLGVYMMNAVNFFRSEWPVIRANAAMMVGFILGNLTKDGRRSINVDHICSALTTLVDDKEAIVRKKASEALSLLSDY